MSRYGGARRYTRQATTPLAGGGLPSLGALPPVEPQKKSEPRGDPMWGLGALPGSVLSGTMNGQGAWCRQETKQGGLDTGRSGRCADRLPLMPSNQLPSIVAPIRSPLVATRTRRAIQTIQAPRTGMQAWNNELAQGFIGDGGGAPRRRIVPAGTTQAPGVSKLTPLDHVPQQASGWIDASDPPPHRSLSLTTRQSTLSPVKRLAPLDEDTLTVPAEPKNLLPEFPTIPAIAGSRLRPSCPWELPPRQQPMQDSSPADLQDIADDLLEAIRQDDVELEDVDPDTRFQADILDDSSMVIVEDVEEVSPATEARKREEAERVFHPDFPEGRDPVVLDRSNSLMAGEASFSSADNERMRALGVDQQLAVKQRAVEEMFAIVPFSPVYAAGCPIDNRLDAFQDPEAFAFFADVRPCLADDEQSNNDRSL